MRGFTSVESAEVRTVALTGQQFIAARVRNLFDATICLPADGGSQPEPDSVIAGTVFMVGSPRAAATRCAYPRRERTCTAAWYGANG